jgi:hypothetical protein
MYLGNLGKLHGATYIALQGRRLNMHTQQKVIPSSMKHYS